MQDFSNQKIIVALTGGIAAYKAPELVRRLRERGATVRVVMTNGACEFITPLTLQAVSGHSVHRNLLDEQAESGMGHIELAKWADYIVVAPASADFIAKMARGIADDLLSTILLATTAKVYVAPAMNQQMWQHPASVRNVEQIKQDGAFIIGPMPGEQACGDVGYGRMAEPMQIVEALYQDIFDSQEKILAGQHVLLTAGPTWEAIDPVRGLTNRSSGKMGYALAAAAKAAGAKVTLVTGPVCLLPPEGVNVINVESAQQMRDAVFSIIESQMPNIFIAVAAVADYRVELVQSHKIKKGADVLKLELVRNPDILAQVGALSSRPFCVGFAAETENLLEYARTKLEHKKIDVIFANLVGQKEAVFASDENAVTMITDVKQVDFPRQSKQLLAKRMLAEIARLSSNQ